MELERKSVNLKLSEDKEGSFSAVIATLNVIDKDHDVILPGAFTDGKQVLISSYQHESWSGALPVGLATIREKGEEAIAEGQFNLNMVSGREHYEAIKMTGGLQEWSFGFFVTDSEPGEKDGIDIRYLKNMDEKEISPVLVGAGENTRTLDIKSFEGMPYADEGEAVLAAVVAFVDRTKSLADLRRNEGRDISEDHKLRMAKFLEQMEAMKGDLDALLKAPVDYSERFAQLQMEYLAILNN